MVIKKRKGKRRWIEMGQVKKERKRKVSKKKREMKIEED